jgi:hypothetical protein
MDPNHPNYKKTDEVSCAGAVRSSAACCLAAAARGLKKLCNTRWQGGQRRGRASPR